MNWYSTYMIDDVPIQLFILFALWTLAWKGLALWVTGRRGQNVWFVFFLLMNTAGIGEIIYLLATKGFKEIKK